MGNLPILILIVLVLFFVFMRPRNEMFSEGGMAVSDKYCTKLSDVYFRPYVNDPNCRCNYRTRICGYPRRDVIDTHTGNYFTQNHTLV